MASAKVRHGGIWEPMPISLCLTFASWISDVPTKTLRTSLPGETRLGATTSSTCAGMCKITIVIVMNANMGLRPECRLMQAEVHMVQCLPRLSTWASRRSMRCRSCLRDSRSESLCLSSCRHLCCKACTSVSLHSKSLLVKANQKRSKAWQENSSCNVINTKESAPLHTTHNM